MITKFDTKEFKDFLKEESKKLIESSKAISIDLSINLVIEFVELFSEQMNLQNLKHEKKDIEDSMQQHMEYIHLSETEYIEKFKDISFSTNKVDKIKDEIKSLTSKIQQSADIKDIVNEDEDYSFRYQPDTIKKIFKLYRGGGSICATKCKIFAKRWYYLTY